MIRSRTSGGRARGPLALVATLVVALAVLAGQATGAGTATTTLVVQNGEGGNDARIASLKRLDALFEKANPGVTIKHVSKSYADLVKTDALQLSGSNPPDVTHVNQGLGDLGQLVRANLLTPLDSYAARYGWGKRQSAQLLTIDGRATADGKIGSGKLYGISTTGDWVGVFYNKAELKALGIAVPKTLAAFERALAKAKAAGKTPIAFGNLDKWPGIHEFQSVLMAIAPPAQVGSTIFGKSGTKWSTPAVLKAAATVQKWAKAGYYSDGFAGLGYDDATKRFQQGGAVFTITGTWKAGDMATALGSKVGLMLLPSARAGAAAGALASGGLAWAIPAKAKDKALSAKYIDFITSPAAAKVIQAAGDVPAIPLKSSGVSGVRGDALAGWAKLSKSGAMAGYMDWATPTFYDTVTAAVQELMADRITPAAFAKKLDADYLKFHRG
jgi:raffinose/stachyose/melibiose transport system substrate-binding protein